MGHAYIKHLEVFIGRIVHFENGVSENRGKGYMYGRSKLILRKKQTAFYMRKLVVYRI